MKKCFYCGKEIKKKKEWSEKTYKKIKYCSRKCFFKANKSKEKRFFICPNCKIRINVDYPYQAKPRKHLKMKYCSPKCQMEYEFKTGMRDKKEIIKKAQQVSNEKFKKYNWLNSKKSRDKLRKTMQTKEYKEKQKKVHLGKKNGMYGKDSWNKLYPTKKWWGEVKFVKLRKKCLERDNHRCVNCGILDKEKNLYCDHIIPYRICKEHKLENLQMLCGSCHSKKTVQDIKKYFK